MNIFIRIYSTYIQNTPDKIYTYVYIFNVYIIIDNLFPMIMTYFDERNADTFDLSFHLRTLNVHTFFNQFVQLDKEQPSIYRLHVSLPIISQLRLPIIAIAMYRNLYCGLF